jgi:hypothetical protein
MAAASSSAFDTKAAESRASVMKRADGDESGPFTCKDFLDFKPNLSPGEVLYGGSFGGTYFRDIEIDGVQYRDAWKEFAAPATDWFAGLDVKKQVASPIYDKKVNKYKAKCGQSLDEWLSQGWIKTEYDSHGWFHW